MNLHWLCKIPQICQTLIWIFFLVGFLPLRVRWVFFSKIEKRNIFILLLTIKFTQNLIYVPDAWFGSFLQRALVSVNQCSLMTDLQISCKGSVYIPLQKDFTVVCGTCHLKQSKSLGDKLKWLFLLYLCSSAPSLQPAKIAGTSLDRTSRGFSHTTEIKEPLHNSWVIL